MQVGQFPAFRADVSGTLFGGGALSRRSGGFLRARVSNGDMSKDKVGKRKFCEIHVEAYCSLPIRGKNIF